MKPDAKYSWKIKQKLIIPAMFFTMLFLCSGYAQEKSMADEIIIVKDSFSDYVIYHDGKAPLSVRKAAKELQRLIGKATGVKINISDSPAERMFCLGKNPSAEKAGINADELPPEFFIIKSAGKNIYIAGNDTPDNEKTKDGGCSEGTLYGSYEFLERFMSVRWLMPGEIGEDLPSLSTLCIPDGLNIKDGPVFRSRDLRYIRLENSSVKDWAEKQKIIYSFKPLKGSSLCILHNHIWEKLIPGETLIRHPEYMALVNGRRVLPKAVSGNIYTYKFCTSNPELIKEFAGGVIKYFEDNPSENIISISPTDDKGFCECENCRRLDEETKWTGLSKSLYGRQGVSITRRILTFYNDVAKIVREKFPDKTLCGYIYDQYAYPPEKRMKIEANLFLMLAPRAHYAFSLYRKELLEENNILIGKWAELSNNLGYYNLPTKLVDKKSVSAPQPIGVEILKDIFPLLSRYRKSYKGVLFYGGEGWGIFAPSNYLLARLMWHPDADIDAILNEWFERAYGRDAASPMKKIYRVLEEKMSDYKKSLKTSDWSVYEWFISEKVIAAIYLKAIPEIEKLYMEALSGVRTEKQKRRLEMFKNNMLILHWNLRKGGRIENPEASCFYLSDDDFKSFAAENYRSNEVIYDAHKPDLKNFLKPKLNAIREPREMLVPILPENLKPPVLPPLAGDKTWQCCPNNMGKFYQRKTAEPVKKNISGKIFSDNRNFYIEIACPLNDPGALKRECRKNNDSLIYKDDCVEVFIGVPPSAENIYSKFWHITVNANGAIWAALENELRDCSRIKAAAGIEDKTLRTYLVIPFDLLKSGMDFTNALRGNICVSISGEKIQASWSPVPENFDNQEYFGKWHLKK